MAAPSLNTGEAFPVSKQTFEEIHRLGLKVAQKPIERTDTIFVIRPCNVGRMAIFVFSGLYG
jgi:hypothetical protein